MAPEARRDRAETSEGTNPRDGPRRRTAWRRMADMSDGVVLCHRPFEKYRERGVAGGAACVRRCMTRVAMIFTGHRKGLPLRPRPMTSPRTPFFWLVNSRVAKVARRRSASVDVKRLRRRWPTKSWTSEDVKGVVSEGEDVYSPGRRRKKNARQAMSVIADKETDWAAAAWQMRWRRTRRGTGLTRLGGGSWRL